MLHSTTQPWEPRSLLGEYLWLALLGTNTLAAIYWSSQFTNSPLAIIMVPTCLVAIGMLISKQTFGLVRPLLAIAFAVGSLYAVTTLRGSEGLHSGLPFFAPWVISLSLAIVAFQAIPYSLATSQSTSLATPSRNMPLRLNRFSLRTWAVLVSVIALALYMIVAPTIDSVLDSFRERPTSSTVEDLTLLEMLRVQSAKLAVFAIFAYVGASVGSFINVVALSAPRGESVAIRSSACPVCQTPIRRIDNLPIISYLNLGGRCRACRTPIPMRYFWVEVIAASIFGSLFLFELITGTKNVPNAPIYHYDGIVWILLYTKWDVVAVYFYHVLLLVTLLLLLLIERDRQRVPLWLAIVLLIGFAAPAIAYNRLHPVLFTELIPLGIKLAQSVPARLASCLVGALTGLLLARLHRRMTGRKLRGTLTLAAVLIGVALGWQALVTISLLAVVASILASRLHTRFWITSIKWPTAWLFAAAWLHQPWWKTIFRSLLF